MFTSPRTILFSIGSINIYCYGVVIAFATLCSVLVATFISKKYYTKIDKDIFIDLFIYVVLGGIIGARLYYVLLEYNYYSRHILESFMIMQGGLSIHGAILGGVITGLIYTKIKKISFWDYADIFAFALPIGQAIGRWGNFFNSEAFGKPTDIFCKLYIPEAKRPIEYTNFEYFHPTFLYECILDFVIFCILFFIIRKYAPQKSGIIFFSYLFLYSIARFFIETIRIDSALNIYNIPIAQIVSAIIILISITGITLIIKKK